MYKDAGVREDGICGGRVVEGKGHRGFRKGSSLLLVISLNIWRF